LVVFREYATIKKTILLVTREIVVTEVHNTSKPAQLWVVAQLPPKLAIEQFPLEFIHILVG
jgi:hypothetical protein